MAVVSQQRGHRHPVLHRQRRTRSPQQRVERPLTGRAEGAGVCRERVLRLAQLPRFEADHRHAGFERIRRRLGVIAGAEQRYEAANDVEIDRRVKEAVAHDQLEVAGHTQLGLAQVGGNHTQPTAACSHEPSQEAQGTDGEKERGVRRASQPLGQGAVELDVVIVGQRGGPRCPLQPASPHFGSVVARRSRSRRPLVAFDRHDLAQHLLEPPFCGDEVVLRHRIEQVVGDQNRGIGEVGDPLLLLVVGADQA